MAKATVNVGTSGNDGTGDPIRTAFQSLNANHTELYSLLGNGSTLSVTGDVAISSGAATIQAGAVENTMLADNAVDHDELAARYTTEVTKTDTAGTGGSAITLDWATGSIFHFSSSLTGAIELKFDNYKVSQVVDIYGLTGSQTITLNSTASGTEVFNKVGTTNYDGSETNHIQVICLDASASTPVFHYTINKVTSDDTP